MECNAYDVLFKCISLSSIEKSGWAIQNVEGREVLVFTNDLLQCLYSTVHKAGERAQQYLPDVQQEQHVLTTVKEMKLSLVKMLVSTV